MSITASERKQRVPLLKHLLEHATPANERRDQQRHPVSITVEVQPLDANLQETGPKFRAMTRDVSAQGLAFVHIEPVKAPIVRMQLADQAGELVGDVRHCTPVGELGLLFLVGIEVREQSHADQP